MTNKLKRLGLYGISGTGKTTILKELNKLTSEVIWLEGSKLVIEAAEMPLKEFKKLSDDKKYFFREKAIENAFKIQFQIKKHIVIDGHLVFPKGKDNFENVMTNKDVNFYTDYVYLDLPIEIIQKRIQNDNTRTKKHTKTLLAKWAAFELKELQKFCFEYKKPLHILKTTDKIETVNFIYNYIIQQDD